MNILRIIIYPVCAQFGHLVPIKQQLKKDGALCLCGSVRVTVDGFSLDSDAVEQLIEKKE